MLDHFKGSDTTTTIQGETLAPARHTFRMDSFSNPHCTTKGKKKTQRFTHLNEGSDSNDADDQTHTQIQKEHLSFNIKALEATINLFLSNSLCISAISSFNILVKIQ